MTEIAPPPETSSEAPAPLPEAPASLVPEALPEPAWIEAEAEALALVETLDETMQAQWQKWMETLAADVLDPLRAVVQQAVATHQRLAEEAAFGDAATPEAELWRRATAYRQAVAETVMVPLRGFLARRKFGATLGTESLEVLEPLASLVEGASSHRILPRPPALYAPETQDPLLLRVRKSFVRARRRLQRASLLLLNGLRRLFRLAPLPLPAQGRLVPLRDLSAYHVQVRLPQRLDQLHESIQQRLAGLVGRLETALTDWTLAVLEAEGRFDRIDFHQPALLQTLYAADDETPEEPGAAEGIEAFSRAAETFEQALLEAVEAMAEDLVAEHGLHAAADELAEDLRHAGAGKFLLHLKTRRIPLPDKQPAARIQARQQSWAIWHEQTVDRLDLNGHLMTLRKTLLGIEDTLLRRISDTVLRPILQTFRPIVERLQEAQQQAARACDAAVASDDLAALEATLSTLQEQMMEALQEALSDLSGFVEADQALAKPGRSEWTQLQRFVEQLPEHLLIHARPDAGEEVFPDKRPWRIEVRQSAGDIFHPFDEHLAEPAQPLRKEIVRLWGETEQVGHIVQYNLEAALDVLKPSTGEHETLKADEHKPSKDRVEDTRELATDGLRRAAEMLIELTRSLKAPWQFFAGAIFDLFEKDWASLRHRVARSEAFGEEQWYDFLRRARRQGQRLRRRSKERWQKYSQIALRQFKRVRKWTRDLIERGRSAIGTVEATEEDRLRTIDAISRASVRKLQERLPLVYRKLFSLGPVTEPSLLEGRQADLKRIKEHVHRWKSGQSAGALMLAMPPGSGRSSLLNAVDAMLQPTADVRRLTFTTRLCDVADFAASVVEALGIELSGQPSLDSLEAWLLDAPRSKPPQVCLIDNLEHLLLRTLGGSDLVERVLIFFSRTDTKICWIATIGDYAWRFLEKTVGRATGLVTAYRTAWFDSATLTDIIINRHQRSGMGLRFAEPKDLSPLVRRRVRRARTPEVREDILREIYFDRLFRHSGQNVMLALYYWLCSTDFEAEQGLLTVRPIEPLGFRFFESFDMARAFTLKALMLHNTLTLKEHNRIFRMTDAESTYLLESLLNMRLIEPCRPETRRDADPPPSRILPDERYRLHPLILHPTFQLLRERNIIH